MFTSDVRPFQENALEIIACHVIASLTPPYFPPIPRFMGLTWGPSGADRTKVGPMLAPWTLLSGSMLKAGLLYFVSSFLHGWTWFIQPYSSGLTSCHYVSLMITPASVMQPWKMWVKYHITMTHQTANRTYFYGRTSRRILAYDSKITEMCLL